jgi:hypothetical protein
MADIQFSNAGDGGNRDDIPVGESMSHMQEETEFDDEFPGILQGLQLSTLLGRGKGVGVLSGVEFDRLDTDRPGGLDLPGVGVDEETDFDPGVEKLLDAIFDASEIPDNIESSFGGDFLTFFGNESHLMGSDIECNPRDFVGDGHFEVQFDLNGLFQDFQIAILNMSTVFPEMKSDSVGTSEFGEGCGPNGIRLNGATCLTNGSDMIDVDTETSHDGSLSRRKTGSGAKEDR